MGFKISKTFYLEGSKYYKKHLEILNGVIPVKLTGKEIEILSEIIRLGSKDNQGVRNAIVDENNISHSNLTKYIKSLKKKGFIIDNEVIPLVKTYAQEMNYNFTVKNTNSSENSSNNIKEDFKKI